MSPSPDWYPDPTNPARLRYWDGVMWTQWVTSDGDTSEDPIAGASPPPPVEGHAGWSGAPAEPTAPAEASPRSEPATAYQVPEAAQPQVSQPHASRPPGSLPQGTTQPPQPIVANTPRSLTPPPVSPPAQAARHYSSSLDQMFLRGGLGVAALGGIIAAFSTGQVGASQGIFGERLEVEVGGGAFTALVGAIILIATAAAPWLWAQITGIGFAAALAVGTAFAVIAFRTDEDFIERLDVSLGTGGWMILTGSLIAFAGLGLALFGISQRPPKPREGPPDKSKGVAALVLGIAGFPLAFVGSLGITFGLLGMAEARGAQEGRGLAMAGFIVGLVALVLWFLGLTAAMFFAEPTSS